MLKIQQIRPAFHGDEALGNALQGTLPRTGNKQHALMMKRDQLPQLQRRMSLDIRPSLGFYHWTKCPFDWMDDILCDWNSRAVDSHI